MRKYIAYLLLGTAFLMAGEGSYAKGNNKKKKKSDKTEASAPAPKKTSDYDKLFKDKKVKTVKGMMTLHMVDNKQLLVELPLSLLGRDMMILSSVSAITDHTDSYVGGSPIKPQQIRFSKIGNSVQLRRERDMTMVEEGEKGMLEALEKSNLDAIINSYEIKAWNSDSTAVVFDMTEYFTGNEDLLDPIDMRGESKLKLMGVSYRHSRDRSFLDDVRAFSDNISIYTYNTYDASYKNVFNKVTTARMTRTIALLPEKPMAMRLADYRIPLTVMGKYNYHNGYKQLEATYFATRWRIEPSDQAAYDRGELVEPVKPIVIYMDTTFTDLVRNGITEGFLTWNEAFEKIGFKNVIQIKPFPSAAEDPEFDPENFKYSCIRYVPSLAGDTKVRTYTDPRTGEILRTSILVCHNYVYELPFEAITNIGHADPDLQQRYIPDAKLQEFIKNDFAWLVGTSCLGLSYNLTASAAYPTDSLRSASFTQKYGTTPSILDMAKYNFVAPINAAKQGIRLTPKSVGEYDCHVVKCLYKPIPEAKDLRDELRIIEGWIDEHVGDPKYRYENSKDCPDCGANDVGNDDLLNFKYAVENLKFSMQNFMNWISDKDDPIYMAREALYQTIYRRYRQVLTQVAIAAYGIKTYEKKAGDPVPSYEYTPKERQLEAWEILYANRYEPDWVRNFEAEKLMEIVHDRSESHRDYLFLLMSATASRLFAFENVEGSIGHTEYIQYMYKKLFEPTRQGKNLNANDRYYQMHFFRSMVASSKMVDKNQKYKDARVRNRFSDEIGSFEDNVFDYSDPEACLRYIENAGILYDLPVGFEEDQEGIQAQYGRLKKWPIMYSQVSRQVYYMILKDMRTLLKAHYNEGDAETRAHYRLMLDKLNRLMD